MWRLLISVIKYDPYLNINKLSLDWTNSRSRKSLGGGSIVNNAEQVVNTISLSQILKVLGKVTEQIDSCIYDKYRVVKTVLP